MGRPTRFVNPAHVIAFYAVETRKALAPVFELEGILVRFGLF